MQTPPPFSPPGAPPKKSNSPLLIVIIVVLCVLIPCGGLIALGYYGFNLFGKTVGPMASCVLMFEGARASIVDYKDAHEGKLPNAATWQDDIKPYYKKWFDTKAKEAGPFAPPGPDAEWGCKAEGKTTGIAFNSDLGGKKWDDIKDHRTTVLIFEIDSAMKNAHQPYKERSKKGSPKIMGEERGWIDFPMEGSSDSFD